MNHRRSMISKNQQCFRVHQLESKVFPLKNVLLKLLCFLLSASPLLHVYRKYFRDFGGSFCKIDSHAAKHSLFAFNATRNIPKHPETSSHCLLNPMSPLCSLSACSFLHMFAYFVMSISYDNIQHSLYIIFKYCNRRKFRSQTSDNVDRWKSRGGKSQRGAEKKREDQRRERVRRKKMQAREKLGKSRNTVFLQWFVAPEDRNIGSLKRRVRSYLAR